jgi:transposase-like protein
MRMEVITRTERKRRYSDDEKARLLAECDAQGSSVIKVAARHEMATSVLHRWRLERRRAAAEASTRMQFISFGDIDAIIPDATQAVAIHAPRAPHAHSQSITRTTPPTDMSHRHLEEDDRLVPHPGGAPGTIAIALMSGVRVSVDSYVNEKALARVLNTLKRMA